MAASVVTLHVASHVQQVQDVEILGTSYGRGHHRGHRGSRVDWLRQ